MILFVQFAAKTSILATALDYAAGSPRRLHRKQCRLCVRRRHRGDGHRLALHRDAHRHRRRNLEVDHLQLSFAAASPITVTNPGTLTNTVGQRVINVKSPQAPLQVSVYVFRDRPADRTSINAQTGLITGTAQLRRSPRLLQSADHRERRCQLRVDLFPMGHQQQRRE